VSLPSQFRNLHHFLANQSFYAVLLSSLFAFALYFGRAAYSGDWIVYRNLTWNLVLAWVPFAFSFLAAGLFRTFPGRWWIVIPPALVWLVFFPNAPYLVTDFFHLVPRLGVPLWYDVLLLAVFSWTGIFLAIASLRTMHIITSAYIGRILGWVFVVLALSLSGLGIYLGRFGRWNSWDLLFNPKSIIKEVAVSFLEPLDNLRFFGFSIIITGFLFICYITFISMRHLEANEI
jgi:uncharacterized membrane protein